MTLYYQKPKIAVPPSALSSSPNRARDSHLTRRRALGAIVLSTAGLSISPRSISALTLDPTDQLQLALGLKKLLIWFVRTVLPSAITGLVVDKISLSEVTPAPPSTNFHNSFSNELKVQVAVPPTQTKYKNSYFGIADGYPLMDSENPPRPIKDLNRREMQQLINVKEINFYGSAPFPCSERSKPTDKDLSAFEHVVSQHYGVDPASLDCQYVRAFSNGKGYYTGFGVQEKIHPDHQHLVLAPNPQ